MTVPPSSAAQRQAFLAAVCARGQSFTYSDGTTTIDPITMIRSRPESNQADATELIVIESKEWNFLVEASDLIDGDSNFIEPSIGHIITDQEGVRYKVQPVGASQNCWRWSDGLHTFIRIGAVQQ